MSAHAIISTMDAERLAAIEDYQCSGCVRGCGVDEDCFQPSAYDDGCAKHVPGTMISGIGMICLGMPTGFNRLGSSPKMPLYIFDKFKNCTFTTIDTAFDKFNVPVWKYKNEYGHTIVRGISPRINETFVSIFLEDCLDEVDCLEITDEDLEGMD